jgi:hypothetical protein
MKGYAIINEGRLPYISGSFTNPLTHNVSDHGILTISSYHATHEDAVVTLNAPAMQGQNYKPRNSWIVPATFDASKLAGQGAAEFVN